MPASPDMQIIARRKPDQNRAAVDPWTVVHFSAGLAVGLMAIPLRSGLAAAIAYEVMEQWFERYEWGQDLFETSGPESLPNAFVDTAVFYVGHRLGERWNERR